MIDANVLNEKETPKPAAPAVKTKRVVATAKGHYVGTREPGEEFDVPVTLRGSWFKEVVKAVPVEDDLA